jgi:hypothetical protein
MEFDEPSGRLIVLATPKAHGKLSERFHSEAK